MRFGGSAGRNPRSGLRGEDECPSRLAGKRQLVVLVDRAVPDVDSDARELGGRGATLADYTELREAEKLSRGEATLAAAVADAAVGDQLDDVAGRFVDVARLRVPRFGLEDDLAGLRIGQQLDPLVRPVERRVEPVARGE